MATGPVAERRCADLKRDSQPVTGVEAATTYLRKLPRGAEIACSPFRVGLKSAAGKYHTFGSNVALLAFRARLNAGEDAVASEKAGRAGLIGDIDPGPLAGSKQRLR